jgi:hypothetical protein
MISPATLGAGPPTPGGQQLRATICATPAGHQPTCAVRTLTGTFPTLGADAAARHGDLRSRPRHRWLRHPHPQRSASGSCGQLHADPPLRARRHHCPGDDPVAQAPQLPGKSGTGGDCNLGGVTPSTQGDTAEITVPQVCAISRPDSSSTPPVVPDVAGLGRSVTIEEHPIQVRLRRRPAYPGHTPPPHHPSGTRHGPNGRADQAVTTRSGRTIKVPPITR